MHSWQIKSMFCCFQISEVSHTKICTVSNLPRDTSITEGIASVACNLKSLHEADSQMDTRILTASYSSALLPFCCHLCLWSYPIPESDAKKLLMRIMLKTCWTNRAYCRSDRVKLKPLPMLGGYFILTMDRRVVAKWTNSVSATKKVGLDIVEPLSVDVVWSSTTLGFESSSETSISISSSSDSSWVSSLSGLATMSNNIDNSCLIFPLYGPWSRKCMILKIQEYIKCPVHHQVQGALYSGHYLFRHCTHQQKSPYDGFIHKMQFLRVVCTLQKKHHDENSSTNTTQVQPQ